MSNYDVFACSNFVEFVDLLVKRYAHAECNASVRVDVLCAIVLTSGGVYIVRS